jgi:hypothetical protein
MGNLLTHQAVFCFKWVRRLHHWLDVFLTASQVIIKFIVDISFTSKPCPPPRVIILLVYSLSPGATQPIVGVYFTALYRALASSRTRLLDHIQRRATVGRTPLNE